MNYFILFEMLFFAGPMCWVACDALYNRSWNWFISATILYGLMLVAALTQLWVLFHAVGGHHQ